MEWTTVLSLVLGSNVVMLIVSSIINRKTTKIDHTERLTTQYKELASEYEKRYDGLIDDYEAHIARLGNRINDLRENLSGQIEMVARMDEKITHLQDIVDTLTAQNLRHKLIISILIMQLKGLQQNPLIPFEQIDTVSDQQLHDMIVTGQTISDVVITDQQLQYIASAMRDIEKRRGEDND